MRISIGDSEHVPAGRFAMEVIENIRNTNSSLADGIVENIVSKEMNVRAVLDKVVIKEVDAGIVYKTDAYTEKNSVKIIAIPDEFTVVPKYPIATLKESDDKKLANKFVQFVLSKEGQQILIDYGFTSPIANPPPFKFNEETIDGGRIVVYAAASLTDSYKMIGKEFESITGIIVEFKFLSSGHLRSKIEGGAVGGGAGADVFASASMRHMDILIDDKFVNTDDSYLFAENTMVIIVPKK